METTKEKQERMKRADDDSGGDSVQLPLETSPYVQYKKGDGLEDYNLRAYGARGHLPVSDIPHGGSGTDAPTIPGTAAATVQRQRQPQRDQGGDAAGRVGTATDAINRQGVP
ncbi:hypothetical protein ABZP36_034245 [Zizania latifolia]